MHNERALPTTDASTAANLILSSLRDKSSLQKYEILKDVINEIYYLGYADGQGAKHHKPPMHLIGTPCGARERVARQANKSGKIVVFRESENPNLVTCESCLPHGGGNTGAV